MLCGIANDSSLDHLEWGVNEKGFSAMAWVLLCCPAEHARCSMEEEERRGERRLLGCAAGGLGRLPFGQVMLVLCYLH
jgi:hypothetical protein